MFTDVFVPFTTSASALSSFATPLISQVLTGQFWLWQFLGRLHPMMVHFPIVLLIVAGVLEGLTMTKRSHELRSSIGIMLALGAASAVLSVLLGWLLESREDYGGEILSVHKWAGIATTVLAIAALWLHGRGFSRQQKNIIALYRATLGVTIAGVIFVGHFGASLTHGNGFLTEVLPWNDDNIPQGNPDFNVAVLQSAGPGDLTEKQIADLNLEVRSIFAHNCYKCHSAEKIKGELRLDSKSHVFKGGESGPVIEPGHPEESEMMRRLLLPREDEESMPPKGKKLSDAEIATLRFWIQSGAPWPDNADQKSVYRVAELTPRRPALPPDQPGLANPIDRFVNRYFEENDIQWPDVVDDRLYIRRVYLDLIGLLPPQEKVNAFIVNPNPEKRELLVRELLNREEDYAQHWLTFWNDALRNDYTGTGYITKGRFAITGWLYDALKTNKPYDQFVRELVSPDERSSGFIRGIQWRGTVNASQRVEMQAAQNISQVFLGLNLKCASCHDSFISDWKLEDAYAFANIFSDSTLEINRCDKPTGKFAGTKILFEELGEIDTTKNVEEKLKQLADFLTAPKNGRLYRTIVNRMWAQLMGRGLVEPVDQMDNEPWSQDLLDWLASDFVETQHNLKALLYMITTSKAYQLPSVETQSEADLLASDYKFEGMHRRRLSAEQFADAVSMVVHPVYSDTLSKYKPIKELNLTLNYPFARASLVKNDPFLTALGRPNRENVSTSRSSQASLLQALELTNGDAFNAALEAGGQKWASRYSDSRALVTEVYRQALCRNPEAEELETAVKLLGDTPEPADVEDLLWSVMLLPEFQLIY